MAGPGRWRPAGAHVGQAAPKPPPERPSGVIGKFDAADAAGRLAKVAEDAPECWEGEDLTAARGLVERLKEFVSSGRSLMGLSEEEERVLRKGLDCAAALERTVRAEAAAAAPPAAEAGGISPLVPIGIAAGVGLLLVVLLT